MYNSMNAAGCCVFMSFLGYELAFCHSRIDSIDSGALCELSMKGETRFDACVYYLLLIASRAAMCCYELQLQIEENI